MINELRFIIHNDEQPKEAMCKPTIAVMSMESDFHISRSKTVFMDRYINILELLIELREPMQN